VAPHGVWVGARAAVVGHGHGRDQEAAQGEAGAVRIGERTSHRSAGRVGAVEADTLAELQGRGGRRRSGAGEAGVVAM
jgi:hypothetical protein